MTDDLQPTTSTPAPAPDPMAAAAPGESPVPSSSDTSTSAPEPAGGAPAAATATAPVGAGSGRWRWLVALGAVAILVVAIVAVVLNVGKGGSAAVTTGYLPATTVAYLDARLDLPGDQRDQLASLLSRFPGFADQAALDTKLSDTFDRLLRQASADRYSYSADVKPWFGGRVAVAMTSLPALAADTIDMPPVLGLVGVSDAVKARAELERILKDATDAGATVAVETIDGATLWTIDDAKASSAQRGHAVIALTTDMIVVGADRALVTASVALGRGNGESLAGSATFNAAVGALPEARLGTLYVDAAALKVSLAAMAASQPGLDVALAAFPDRIVGSVRVADGNVIVEVRAHAPGALKGSGGASAIAALVPGDSAALIEVGDLGAALKSLLTTVKTQLGSTLTPEQLKPIEGALGGPLESLFDWVGDGAVVVRADGAASVGALVATVNDTAAAKTRVAQLSLLLSLAATDPKAGIHVVTSDHAGTTVTSLTVDAMPGVGIGWALKDDLFVIGVGDGAVAWVLDVTPETALARAPGYVAASKAVGSASPRGMIYLDIARLSAGLESLIPADQQARYKLEVKPMLAPLTGAIAYAFQDGDDAVGRLVFITTRQ